MYNNMDAMSRMRVLQFMVDRPINHTQLYPFGSTVLASIHGPA